LGLAQQALSYCDAAVDLAGSWTIGDNVSDIEFGKALGTRTALLLSRYWSTDSLAKKPDLRAMNLRDAAEQIVNLE
jgi:histidinol phosphatase-like enzyme